jgi:hypothetical protein
MAKKEKNEVPCCMICMKECKDPKLKVPEKFIVDDAKGCYLNPDYMSWRELQQLLGSSLVYAHPLAALAVISTHNDMKALNRVAFGAGREGYMMEGSTASV